MTIPQDSRAPHRQQRWIELVNAGNEVIPPFAALEIAPPGSHRPEASGGYTPLDGRTVLYVRKPTHDNPCLSVINGPCEIPIYGYGKVGTMDDPMLAMVASASYETGIDVGIKAGSYQLHKGYCGYRIIGDYDAVYGTMRVKRWDECAKEMYVQAYDCIKPGTTEGRADPMKWDATRKCYVVDSTGTRITICDPQKWLLALPGDCFKVERLTSCDETSTGDLCYRPSMPYGLKRLVKVKSEIKCGKCGNVTIMKRTTSGSGSDCASYWEETSCIIKACNMSNRRIACDNEEYAWADIIPGDCCDDTETDECLAVLTPFHRPYMVEGTLADNLCFDGAATLTGAKHLDSCNWGDPPTTAENPLILNGCKGRKVIAVWAEEDCGWKVVSVSDEKLPDYMKDIKCKTGSCAAQKVTKLYPRYGHFCHCDSDPDQESDSQLTGTRITYATGVELGAETGSTGCSFLSGTSTDSGTEESPKCDIVFASRALEYQATVVKRRSACVFCAEEESATDATGPAVLACGDAGDPERVSFTKVQAATTIEFTCAPCPELAWNKTAFYALCVGSEATGGSGECDCGPCPESSASATPSGA